MCELLSSLYWWCDVIIKLFLELTFDLPEFDLLDNLCHAFFKFLNSSMMGGSKQSSDLQFKMDLAVELCKQGLQQRFSNLLEALSEKLNKEKSTAHTIVRDMLVFNVDARSGTFSHMV